jgi:CBS domain-containing protein
VASIQSLMTTKIYSVTCKTPIADVLALLIKNKISGLPVLDEQGRIIGAISEKDLLKAFYEDDLDVLKLMTPEPSVVSVESPLVEVFDVLMTHDFRRVFVHDEGVLVGLISRSDLMPVIMEALNDRFEESHTI